ncbi:2-polyprenyl-3-methyl-5-hydroxy-6-metoxy-1,4-benzoquinol methylase [Nitrobacteraceae bacterium AZCC 1564]
MDTMTATPHCRICARPQTTYYATAQDVEYFTTKDEFTFYRCEDCDVLFLHPMPVDRLSEIYPPNYYSFHVDSGRSIAQRIKQFLDDRAFAALTRDIKGTSLAALDVGGGSGWLLNDLKRADPRVDRTAVVDIDTRAEGIARANGHSYHLTTFERFDTNERFDVILMLNLIEHVPDPVAVLRKAKELLRPGGRIWIKTPNFDALDARIFKNRSWGGFHTPRHFVLFTRDSLVRHCEAAGFTVVHSSYTQGAPFWTVSAINELRKLGLCTVTSSQPSIENPLTPLFHIAFAAFDFLRMPFSKTSQVNIHLTVPSRNGD